jgi:hypothetical protein
MTVVEALGTAASTKVCLFVRSAELLRALAKSPTEMPGEMPLALEAPFAEGKLTLQY